MTATAFLLLALTLAVAVADWMVVAAGRRPAEYLLKPLTMVGLIGVALALEPANDFARGALVVGLAVGLAPALLYQTITSSNAATVSNLFRELGSRIAAEDYDSPTFSIDLLAKDVRLATEMAKAHGAPPILARSIEFLNEAARAQGMGKLDTAAMWKLYAGIWSGRA